MWVCVCLKRRQSPFRFVNNIIIIFHVRSIRLFVYFAASQSACATKSLFYLPFYDKPDICLVCSHPLVCNFNSARTFRSWRTLHSIVFVCEFVNYLTENSFQFSLPYAVDVWSWARHRTHHTKHIPCTTVHCDHWPSSSPNKCRIIVVVSLLCGWGWGGSSMSLDCKFINAFSFTMHARSATTSQRWNIFMPFAQYFGVLQMKCQRNCQTFEMQTIE